MAITITLTQLEAAKACNDQRELFKERFGESVTFATLAEFIDSCVENYDFEYNWAARNLLAFENKLEYRRNHELVREEHVQQRGAICEQYERKQKAISAEYERQHAPILAEYERQREAIRAQLSGDLDVYSAEYQRQHAPIRADYVMRRTPIRADYLSERGCIDYESDDMRETIFAEYKRQCAAIWARLYWAQAQAAYSPGK